MAKQLQIEVLQQENGDIKIYAIFLDTGEIRQKRMTKQAFFKRLFIYNEWAQDPALVVLSTNLVRR